MLPGRFNVVQMAIGVRKRAASALPTADALKARCDVYAITKDMVVVDNDVAGPQERASWGAPGIRAK